MIRAMAKHVPPEIHFDDRVQGEAIGIKSLADLMVGQITHIHTENFSETRTYRVCQSRDCDKYKQLWKCGKVRQIFVSFKINKQGH